MMSSPPMPQDAPQLLWDGDDLPTLSNSGVTPLQAMLRHKWAILVFAVLLTMLAAMVVRRLPVRYAASAAIMVDARKLQVLQAQSVLSSPLLDLDRLRTDMEQLRSPAIAQAVVEQLDLTHVPEFCQARPSGPIVWLRGLLGSPLPAPASACSVSTEDAAEQVLGIVSAINDGRSYIIKVNAETASAHLAASIANAYARAFVSLQRQQDSDAATQADSWLSSYLTSLRTQMLAADAAVETYQHTNQLTPLRGETVVSQRLAELNSQLTVATSALAEKQAVLRQVQGMAKGGGRMDTSAPAVLASPVIQQLIEKQSDLAASLAELRTREGESYPTVRAGEVQLRKFNQSIEAEIGRTLAGLSDEVAALGARKASIAANVQQLQVQTDDQGMANVHLQELQRDADADHRLYESMVTRLHEVDAERHMQWPASSVVVEATAPKVPSFPRVKMMLAGVFMMALVLGTAGAFLLSLLSRVFRDVDQVEREIGARVLGLFPRPPRRSTPANMVLDWPASLEAETVNFVLANLARRSADGQPEKGRAIMISSALPGEGKSSFAVALGQAAARSGRSVLLLDCDVRSPGATHILKGKPTSQRDTEAPVAAGVPVALEQSGMYLLPMDACLPDARRLLGSPDVSTILDRLRAQYDLVLIDTPPVLAVPDALALAPLVDDMLLVVDWRRTPRHSAAAAAKALRRRHVDISGIVLSKVDLRQFARRGAEGLFARHYSGYHQRPKLRELSGE